MAMKVCFIADSSSLHVQRIISYFVKNHDDILILSSARRPCFIAGANTVHLLHHNGSSTFTVHEHNKLEGKPPALYKKTVPKFLKAFISRISHISHDLYILFRRKFCLDKIKQFNPDL